ncbi:MAG: Fic family protein [Anaeroplasmataceae bacterium]
MDTLNRFSDYKTKDSDFIVRRFKDISPKRTEEDYLYNLSFFRNKIIKGVLSTEGNLASIEDIELLTTGTFSTLKFSRSLSEMDLQEVWAMNKVMSFMEANITKPVTRELIETYNSMIVVGPKSRMSGRTRGTNVFINGSSYTPPDFQMLDRLFNNIIEEVNLIEGEINKAFSLALGIAKMQIFIDGNKRTANVVALHHLCFSGQPMLIMKNNFAIEYIKSMKDFYETSNNESISKVLYDQLDINQ